MAKDCITGVRCELSSPSKTLLKQCQQKTVYLSFPLRRNILSDFRRRGKLRQSLTWEQFLRVQIHSFYAMDFFSIDTMVKQRFYVFFIIYHQTREIVQFAITQNPGREYVRQQLIEFGDRRCLRYDQFLHVSRNYS